MDFGDGLTFEKTPRARLARTFILLMIKPEPIHGINDIDTSIQLI
jgi:hypothetical protein